MFDENEHIDFVTFFTSIKNKVISLLEELIRIHGNIKVNMELFGKYVLQTDGSQGSEGTTDIKSFNTVNKIIDGSSDLEECFAAFVDMMTNQTSEFQEHGSGMFRK